MPSGRKAATSMSIRADVKDHLDQYRLFESMSYSDLLGLLLDVLEDEFKGEVKEVRQAIVEKLLEREGGPRPLTLAEVRTESGLVARLRARKVREDK